MNKRFIELVSSRRNRNEYPNPSEFEVLLSNRVSNGYYNDPVSKYSSIIKVNYKVIRDCEYNIDHNDSNTTTKFVVEINYGSDLDPKKLLPYSKRNYYAGFPMQETVDPPALPNFQFIVKSSEFINSYEIGGNTYIRFWFTIDIELDNTLLPTVDNKTQIDDRSLVNNTTKTLWLPESIETDNYYNSYYIRLNDDSVAFNIKSYDGETHVLGLEDDNSTNLSSVDIIGVYKSIPDDITTNDLTPLGIRTFTFNILDDSKLKINDYIGGITNYLTTYYKILNKNGTTITVNKDIENNPTSLAEQKYEILPITHDNSSAFNYTGSTVSQQQMVCYEVQLLKLVLPNVELETGGRIALYPYVYVKLQNSTSPNSGITNIIYSNNPNSKDMLFRASIDDTSHPLTIPFVKLKGDDMVQTIKFKPNDNLRFGVYLPNGEPLKTELDDNQSPLEPNPLLQISAVFSIKRL